MMRIRFNLDALGVCASTLCMIHCLALPLLLAALPLWSVSGRADASDAVIPFAAASSPATCRVDGRCTSEQDAAATGMRADDEACAACCSTPLDFWIHVSLLATVAPLGLVAWGVGYRHHRRLSGLTLGMLGVLLLSSALLFGTQLFGGRGEQLLTVTGSICMVSAHLWNRRQCRCCKTPDLTRVVEIESVPSVSPQPTITEGSVS